MEKLANNFKMFLLDKISNDVDLKYKQKDIIPKLDNMLNSLSVSTSQTDKATKDLLYLWTTYDSGIGGSLVDYLRWLVGDVMKECPFKIDSVDNSYLMHLQTEFVANATKYGKELDNEKMNKVFVGYYKKNLNTKENVAKTMKPVKVKFEPQQDIYAR